MAPNSEERRRLDVINWNDEAIAKEKQRPPIYNPEDYALSLRKWGRRPSSNGPSLYIIPSNSDTDITRTHNSNNTLKDYVNPLMSNGNEMTLRQFGTVSELLYKLKADLKLAYPSFVQEFVGDPFDGIALLLDLLRAIQLSQVNNTHYTPGSSATTGKIPPSVQRRALLDELTCLQCLFCACIRYAESIRKLTTSSAGLFTLAVCIMSNVNKSRIIALQLLAKACESSSNGHSSVSEALSTLRLRFGEPVRFRFLVGMLSSAGGQGELLATGLKFVNSFLNSTSSIQKRLYVQAELEQAGFDINSIKKNIPPNTTSSDLIYEEIEELERNHIDIELLQVRLEDADKENNSLRDKLLVLESRVQLLQEEKGILVSLEQCLKDRCNELHDEVVSLKSGKSLKISDSQKRTSTPAEDEGISSSERSITPEDVQQETSVYEIYKVNTDTITLKNNKETTNETRRLTQSILLDDEEETTIEEVMEELNNIINKAESEEYGKEKERKKRIKMEEAQINNKIKMRVNSNISINDNCYNETEIVPSNLHPQPPRKTRSLIHLFVPSEDYEYDNNKEIFFENETMYTSEEGSDSLLSASKCVAKDKTKKTDCNRITIKQNETFKRSTTTGGSLTQTYATKQNREITHQTRTTIQNNAIIENHSGTFKRNASSRISTIKHEKLYKSYMDDGEYQRQKLKSKSLDRIDDGLSTMVDIVVTNRKNNGDNNNNNNNNNQYRVRPQSDSGKLTHTLRRDSTKSTKLSQIFTNQSIEERHKIFLPMINKYEDKDAYYFPRIQEKRNSNGNVSNNFHVKRGHNNAGLYSGQISLGNNNNNNNNNNNCKKNEFISTCSKNSNSKISDYPSGLY